MMSRNPWPTRLPAFLAVLLCSFPAQAERFGLKGIVLGSPVSQIANNPSYDCRAVKTPTADRVCSLRKDETDTLAGAPVSSAFYYYDQGALTGIVVHLDEKRFPSVLAALSSKYGRPSSRTETVKNLSGKPFENSIHRWQLGDDAIVAQRYSGRLDQSSVRISDETAAARIRQRRDLLIRQPGSDL